MLKIAAWYDNEWGYSNRLVEVVADLGKSLDGGGDPATAPKSPTTTITPPSSPASDNKPSEPVQETTPAEPKPAIADPVPGSVSDSPAISTEPQIISPTAPVAADIPSSFPNPTVENKPAEPTEPTPYDETATPALGITQPPAQNNDTAGGGTPSVYPEPTKEQSQ